MAANPIYPTITGPILVAKQIAEGDTNAIVDVYDNSLGTVAVKLESLVITTDNTADRIVKFYLYDGAISHLIGSVTVPDLSGTNGATDARVNVLSTLGVAGSDGVLCIWVPAGKKLRANVDATLVSGKFLYIVGRGITYS